MKNRFTLYTALVATASLAACGSTPFGTKAAPDETAVIEGPSLLIPPDYTLRPPGTQASPHKQADPRAQGQKIITGSTGTPAAATTGNESWLIDKAGGTARDPNIRDQLEAEAAAEVKEEKKGWFERQKENLLGKDEPEKPAVKTAPAPAVKSVPTPAAVSATTN